ncbi:hypothetical protein BNCALIDO_00164 [Aeromonas phage vB_AdhM_TS9]|nr:hypothetical protein BNCALIDO_00164 [Aeromonas phage vB_AdhM_TS9]
MKVKYGLDKEKFVKVYNELKIDTGNVADLYGLASKHDKTNDKDLKDIMYAIEHNINFEISDINVVKKINEMYDYYDKPNRLTQQEIIDCIKEVNELQLKLQTQTMATIMEAHIIGKDYDNKVEMVLTIFTNFYHSPQLTTYVRHGSMSEVFEKIKEYEMEYFKDRDNGIVIAEMHKKKVSEGFISGIFKPVFNWK